MTTSENVCSVRKALVEDAPLIAAIHEASRRQAYRELIDWDLLNSTPLPEREQNWIKQLHEAESSGKEIFVAEIDGRIVGFAVIGPEEGAGSGSEIAELDRLYVAPEHWAQGVGKSLFQRCLEWVGQRPQYRRLDVWTLEFNGRARRFYETLGFVWDGGRRKIGPYPDDVRYSLPLK